MRATSELLVWKTVAMGSLLLCGTLWWRGDHVDTQREQAHSSSDAAAEIEDEDEQVERRHDSAHPARCPAQLSVAVDQANRPDARCMALGRLARCRQIDKKGVERIAYYTEPTRSLEVRACATTALGETQSLVALPILNRLIGDAFVGDAALRALALFEHPDARQALIETVRQGPEALRMTALSLLAERRDPEAVALIGEKLKLNEPYMREQLIWLLGSTRDPRALSILSAELDHGTRGIQFAAINALGELGGEGASNILLGVIETTPALASTALQALGRTGTEESTETLLSAATGEYGAQAAVNALQALVPLESPEATALMQRELVGENPSRVAIALDYLATHHVQTAVPTILRIAREGGQAGMWGAVNALSRIGGSAAVAGLEQLARLPGEAGQAALQALSGMPEGQALARRVTASLPADRTPMQVIEQLGRDSSPEARAALINAARGADPSLSQQALGYLAQRNDAESFEAIADLAANSKVPGMRAAALLALGQSGHPDAGARIHVGLRDPSSEVRMQAVQLLAEHQAPNSQAALISASRDPDQGVAGTALSALGQLGTPEALSRLEEVAGGSNGPTKAQALQALANVSPSRAARFAEQAAGVADRDASVAAVQLVPMFPRPVGVRILTTVLRQGDYGLSREALPYLGQFGLSRRELSPLLDHLAQDPQAPEDVRSLASQMLASARQ